MNQFFDYNNNVFRVLGGLADCLILGALWIVCSIPVVTMGAATAAVYHAVNKSIVHGQGYAFREYCTALKTDLKQTTGAWLLWGILAAFLAADLVVTRQFLAQGSALGALYYFFIVLSAMALAWEFYLTAYMARFEGTIRESMKKTLVMVVANLGWSALLVAVCSDVQRYTVPDCTVSGSVCTGEKLCAREGIPQVQDAGGSRQRIGNDP